MLVGTSRIRCLVVDDHEVLRTGLVRVLEREDDMEVAGQTGDPSVVVPLVARRRPDIAIIDLHASAEAAVELSREIIAAGTGTRAVLYTGITDPVRLEQALEAGASGYVLKASPTLDLVRALRLVHGGHTYVDSILASSLIRRRGDDDRSAALSPREREVLQLLAEGLTTEHVAGRLFLSPATVRSYAEGAMQKLESRNRTHAVAEALRRALIR